MVCECVKWIALTQDMDRIVSMFFFPCFFFCVQEYRKSYLQYMDKTSWKTCYRVLCLGCPNVEYSTCICTVCVVASQPFCLRTETDRVSKILFYIFCDFFTTRWLIKCRSQGILLFDFGFYTTFNEAAGWTVWVWYPSRSERFICSTECPNWLWGPPRLQFNWYCGFFGGCTTTTTNTAAVATTNDDDDDDDLDSGAEEPLNQIVRMHQHSANSAMLQTAKSLKRELRRGTRQLHEELETSQDRVQWITVLEEAKIHQEL